MTSSTRPPNQPPTPPPPPRPPTPTPPARALLVPDLLAEADAALFAAAEAIRADFTLPLRPAVPSFDEGEHRLIGRVSRP